MKEMKNENKMLMDISLMSQKFLSDDAPECDIDTQLFCTKLKAISEKYWLLEKIQPFIEVIQITTKGKLWRKDKHLELFYFTEEFENKFFMYLLGTIKEGTVLTKYTNTDALKRICENNEQSMASLIGMNDSTECTYTTQYMVAHGYKRVLPDDEDTVIGMQSFITSFTTKKDDLTMWRLYGDDAKGVALHFKVGELADGFYLAPVSYSRSNHNHPELSVLVEMASINIDNHNFNFQHLYKWRYFFKPHEYSIENEIRLLYISDKLDKKSKWITTGSGVISPLITFPIVDDGDSYAQEAIVYPLRLVGADIGPQFPEQEKNIETIKRMFKIRFEWKDNNFKVNKSNIKNYKNI